MAKYLLALFFTLWAAAAGATGTVVLLIDESSSLDITEMELQYSSYERAMTGVGGMYAVDVVVIGFSQGPRLLSMGSNLEAQAVFAALNAGAGDFDDVDRGSTCLSAGLALTESLLPDLRHPVVVDISGDGEANCEGRDNIPFILDRMASQGVQVNTLYIAQGDPAIMGPDAVEGLPFYQSLQRNDGFTLTATGFEDFERALFEKLVLELAYLE